MTTDGDHALRLELALEHTNAHPDWIVWHYVHLAIEQHGDISKAARAMGMHRRTLQRILAKRCPPKRPVINSAYERKP